MATNTNLAESDALKGLFDDVDYSQWERSKSTYKNKHAVARRFFKKEQDNPLLDTIGKKHNRPNTGCSSKCHHPWIPKQRRPFQEQRERKSETNINFTKLLIRTEQKTLAQRKEQLEWLQEENIRLKDAIIEEENLVHEDVNVLLEKYSKFRGAAENENANFIKEKEFFLKDLDETKELVGKKELALLEDLTEMDKKLNIAKKHLGVLVTYKEIAFFDNQAEIERLNSELKTLEVQQESEKKDILDVIKLENRKMAKISELVEEAEVEKIALDTVENVHDSYKYMASENDHFREQILIITKEIENLKDDNAHLEDEIRTALQNPAITTHAAMYPHLFRKTPTCQPDDDVVLDIPKAKLISI